MDPKSVHVIVSLMASEIGGAGGSARFSLSYFIPNSQEGPLLICFGSGSDAERHLNGVSRFWSTMSLVVTLLDKNQDNWIPQDDVQLSNINVTRHSWPYEFEADDDSRGGFLMTKALAKTSLNKRKHLLPLT